jgi:hypothetical protein
MPTQSCKKRPRNQIQSALRFRSDGGWARADLEMLDVSQTDTRSEVLPDRLLPGWADVDNDAFVRHRVRDLPDMHARLRYAELIALVQL